MSPVVKMAKVVTKKATLNATTAMLWQCLRAISVRQRRAAIKSQIALFIKGQTPTHTTQFHSVKPIQSQDLLRCYRSDVMSQGRVLILAEYCAMADWVPSRLLVLGRLLILADCWAWQITVLGMSAVAVVVSR